jgi:anti-sigma factor RsiW
MDCDAIRDDMLDVLYGEGGEAAVRRVEAHQAGCAECRRELASLRRLRGDLAQWRLPEGLGVSPAAPARPRRLPVGWPRPPPWSWGHRRSRLLRRRAPL